MPTGSFAESAQHVKPAENYLLSPSWINDVVLSYGEAHWTPELVEMFVWIGKGEEGGSPSPRNWAFGLSLWKSAEHSCCCSELGDHAAFRVLCSASYSASPWGGTRWRKGGGGRKEEKGQELLKHFCMCIASATYLYWYAVASVPALCLD